MAGDAPHGDADASDQDVSDQDVSDQDLAANSGGAMRIFIFKSEAAPDLCAFGGDLAGLRLPQQFKPWRAVGAIAPDQVPPYKLSRDVIEAAINGRGFQLFRLSKKG